MAINFNLKSESEWNQRNFTGIRIRFLKLESKSGIAQNSVSLVTVLMYVFCGKMAHNLKHVKFAPLFHQLKIKWTKN